MSCNLIVCPVEVCLDDRLTLIELRVLISLYSFRSKNTDLVWPSRSSLMKKTGYKTPQTISKAIHGLAEKGWVETKQNRGPNHYKLHVPECVLDLETVTGPDTVSEPDTVTGSDTVSESDTNSNRIGHQTVTGSVTPEQSNNKPRTKNTLRVCAREEIPKSTSKAPGFRSPSLEDVTSYAESRESCVNPEVFFEYFEAGNWFDAKGQKVKSWKQKFLTWERFGHEANNGNDKNAISKRIIEEGMRAYKEIGSEMD